MSNNEYSECEMMPTHHKCTMCKLVLICPGCCDKRGTIDLNAMECQPCQTRGEINGLAQIKDSVALIVKSESAEVAVAQDNNNLILNIVA